MNVGQWSASATPGAIAHLTGVLGLAPEGCSLDGDNRAVWHLRHGLKVTCDLHDGLAHWHLERETDAR